MPLQQTKEQERAKQAWVDIREVKGQGYEGKYGSLARKFPVLVLTNGLGHALAFLRAKGKEHHQNLYRHFSVWVTSEIYDSVPGTNGLMEKIIEDDSNTYRRATTEALAFAVWIKRFAEAELQSEEDDN